MATAKSFGPSGECAEAFRLLDADALEHWTGLPAGCGHDDLLKAFSFGGGPTQGLLSGRPTMFRVYESLHRPNLIHVWFDDFDHAFLITIESPSIATDVKELLAALGQPEKKLEPHIGYHADAHQWIYASRGLTLYVREHLDQIARLAAYSPASIEYYEQFLGASDEKRYHPWRS